MWTRNGVEICKIKMTQNVCGMGCFLTKRAYVGNNFCKKVLEMCGMGALSVIPFTEKLCGVTQHCGGGGGKSEMKVHTK